MILGCSEWGDYIEELEINYEDNKTEKIKITFTDWWKEKPLFNEENALACNYAYIEDNKPVFAPVKRFLFAKTYPLKNNSFIIKLPNLPNIHIFAISIEQNAC